MKPCETHLAVRKTLPIKKCWCLFTVMLCDEMCCSAVWCCDAASKWYIASLEWSITSLCDDVMLHTSIIIWSLEWLRVVTRFGWSSVIVLHRSSMMTFRRSIIIWSLECYVLSLGWLEQCHSSASFFCDGLSQVYHHLVSGVVTCCHKVGWSSVIVLHHSSVMDLHTSIIIWSLEWLRVVTRLAGAVS